MSHELDMRNGKAAMAYVGQKPWHGLGQELTAGASIDVWAKEAGMAFAIGSAPVSYSVDGKKGLAFEGRNVLFRDDSNDPLGIVSDGYKVVQPREILEFFDQMATDHGFELETAGVLFGGKKYWALAKTPKHFSMGKDEVKAHLMLATACDGSMSTIAKYVTTRVVCQNTIQMALGEKGGVVKTRHNTSFKSRSVQEELGVFGDSWEKTQELILGISKRAVSAQEAITYLVNLLGDPQRPIEDQQEVGNIAHVLTKFQTGNYMGSDLKSAKGTAWGLLNCVTEWQDHDRAKDQSRRLEYAWFSGGAQLKMKALELAGELLKV